MYHNSPVSADELAEVNFVNKQSLVKQMSRISEQAEAEVVTRNKAAYEVVVFVVVRSVVVESVAVSSVVAVVANTEPNGQITAGKVSTNTCTA